MRTCLAALALLLAASTARAQSPQSPASLAEPPCEAMARAAYSAALADAESGFWMELARAVNEPGAQIGGAWKQAWQTRREARAEALVQYEARLRACAALGHGNYAPRLAPQEFASSVDAPLFPLPPGRTWIYEGRTSEGLARHESTVLAQSRVVGGVRCAAVDTREYLDGVLTERTLDWYSQHASGAVWYLGEIAQHFEGGVPVDMDGTWRAGVDGALPGLQLPADPQVGDVWRMEFLLGTAEDVARVVAVEQTVTVPAGTFDHCVAVEEWSPVDVRELVLKYYSPRAGMVLEVNQRTGERLELIEIR